MRAGSVPSERLQRLLDAVVAMASDLTLDGALQSIVDSASELVDATYGFLGVLDGTSNRRLGTFAVHGLDESHQQMIGALPEGRGLLGIVIDRPEPIRVADLEGHPERAGFPVRHPDMRSFLGVPIRIHGEVFGNLYLTNKRSGQAFTAADEEIAVALAGAAGVVIHNARLHQRAEKRLAWLEATADIASSVLKPISREAVKQSIAKRARAVADADVAAILVPDDDARLVVTAVTGITRDVIGRSTDVAWLQAVAESGEDRTTLDVRLDELVPQKARDFLPDLRAVHGQPIPIGGSTGVLLLGWFEGNERAASSLDTSLARGFAQQVALAIQVVRDRERQARLAVFEDRDRIGRDLHDLVIQRLFAVGLTLDSTSRTVGPEAAERLAVAVDSLDQTIKDIRRTIFDLTSPASPLVLREEIAPVARETERLLGFRPQVWIKGDVEGEVPAQVAEQLVAVLHETTSNIVRHAGASSVQITLDVTEEIVLEVRDDGTGLDPDALMGNGLRNLRHRAKNLGGTCEFTEPPGGGLCVRWVVPKGRHDW